MRKAILMAMTGVACSAGLALAQPVAETESGAVRGQLESGVESFKGIPFAAPPVGPLRWRAPMAPEPWEGEREATAFGHDCMQLPFPSDAAPLGTEPAEDCLVMNVWRPEGAQPGDDLPVILWIYGGGFVNGGSSAKVYDGSAFAERDVVFVSFNYRVGRFGFFAHPALSAAREGPLGNYGLMDQRAALDWVARNVGRFGGDADNITVMGESAGGISVLHLLRDPGVRTRIARAVVMSGAGRSEGAMAPRDMVQDREGLPSAETLGQAFAEDKGIEGAGPEALEALRALPAEEVVAGLNMADMQGNSFSSYFRENRTHFNGNEDMFAAGTAPDDIPVMIGATSADLGFMWGESKDEIFAAFGARAEEARQAYDPDGALGVGELRAAIGGDLLMIEPARYVARGFAEAGAPTYYYRFSYVAESEQGAGTRGAPHASEIPFFFRTIDARYGEAVTAQDRAVAERVNDYVVNFARTGVPESAGGPEWPVIGDEDRMLDFAADGSVTVGPDPWQDRLDLVRELVGD